MGKGASLSCHLARRLPFLFSSDPPIFLLLALEEQLPASHHETEEAHL